MNDEQRNIIGQATIMQGNDLLGVSQSIASAALALTALSHGSGESKVRKLEHSPPFIPPLPDVYQLPGNILLDF